MALANNRENQTGQSSDLESLWLSLREKSKGSSVHARPIRSARRKLVDIDLFDRERQFLAVVRPAISDMDLCEWIMRHRDRVRGMLSDHGSILFRGFDIASRIEFESAFRAFEEDLLDYDEKSTPRTAVGGKVYTSTEYPSNQPICLHNEMAYSDHWPQTLGFWCETAPQYGGATPLADGREIMRTIRPGFLEKLQARGVMYVRNYGLGLDMSVAEAFGEGSRTTIEQRLGDSALQFEWKDNDVLSTRRVCRATQLHPHLGTEVWFNSAHMFHIAGLDRETRTSLCALFDESDLPRHAYYGDGTAIDDDDIVRTREVLWESAVRFEWQRGDLLLIDNLLALHGRDPFHGDRRILVAMGGKSGSAGP